MAAAPSRLTSGAVPQPPAKKKTTQRSQQMPARKTKSVPKLQSHPDDSKKIPMPVLIGLAIVIACGAMGGILYSLMHNNEAIVVKTEEPVTSDDTSSSAPAADFDGKLMLRKLQGSDYLQLSGLDKELKCRVDFEGQLSDSVPAPLLAVAVPDNAPHTDSNSMVIPVDVTPANISCAQAAEALFKKLFPDLKPDAWENVTDKYGDDADSDKFLVQEITFPAAAISKAPGAKTDDAAKSDEVKSDEEQSVTAKPPGDDKSETAKSDEEKTDAAKSDASNTDETKPEDAKSEDSASADGAKPAGDAAPEKMYKEYIVYLKHKDRLVACQFIPFTVTKAQLEQTIKQFIPALKKVVRS